MYFKLSNLQLLLSRYYEVRYEINNWFQVCCEKRTKFENLEHEQFKPRFTGLPWKKE